MQFALAHWPQIAAAVGALAYLAYKMHQSGAFGALGSLVSRKAAPSRLDIVAHLDAAYEGFRAIECEEGMAGVRALIPHAYHEHS